MRLGRFAVALACLTACRGNPVVPAQTLASVSGQWSGTFESSNYQPLTVSMSLAQTGDNVTGSWADQSGSGSGGNVSGSVSTTGIAGTVTYGSGQATSCTGTFASPVSGTPSAMTLTLPAGFTGNCSLPGGNPLSPRFVLQRR